MRTTASAAIPLRLYLVRHGETEWSLSGQHTGRTDLPFSHGQFGCVLAAQWIGLPLVDARYFALGTAALSILGHDPHQPEVAVIALWNEASNEKSEPMSSLSSGETKTVSPCALARWENESGEIPAGANACFPKKKMSD